MKEHELRDATICVLCKKPFGHTGLPLFWRVRVERHGVLLDKVRRQDGLAQFIGSTRLASVMGPDEEMTQVLGGPVDVTICEPCAMEPLPGLLLRVLEESS